MFNVISLSGIGVALGDQFCHAESAAVCDPTFWTFTVGKITKSLCSGSM